MNAVQITFIQRVFKQARTLLNTEELTRELDTLYNGTSDYKTIITQNEINSVPEFAAAGLTVARLGAVVYALKMCNVQIDTLDYPAFVALANM